MKQLSDRNRDGSYATRANRSRMLDLCANQLRDLGYNNLKTAHQIKPKHIHRLVNRWKEENISTGTIKNRMAALRWMTEKTGHPDVIAKDNDHYGIGHRTYVTNNDRSVAFDQEKIDAIEDKYIQATALLQREFGLRREEATKFIPGWADRGNRVVLKDSWTKGGREREVPIRTPEQRAALDHAHQIAGKRSLIPADKSYKQHISVFEREMRKVGLSQSHGARHLYAQNRYLELTGWACPAKGGKTSKELTKDEKQIDRTARLEISAELGHHRESITAVYLGR